MFKETRKGMGSTPEMWSANFLANRSLIGRGVHRMTMRGDPRWRLIRDRVAPGSRVLDAGCGVGDWLGFLADQGYDTVGVDYSEGLVDVLRREYPRQTWLHSDIRSIPLPDASVDAVISWGVVEHEEVGPEAAIREFYRLLRPGGWAFVTVPLDSPAMRASSQAQFPPGEGDGEFFQYMFTGAELGEHLRVAGFQVDTITTVSSHFALLAPDLYLWVTRRPKLLQRVAQPVLQTWAKLHGGAENMVIAVGKKP